MPSRSAELWTVFTRKAKRLGYEAAVAWLIGPACPFPSELRHETIERAARLNLMAIRIGQATLTGNRRRRGYFE